jgi:hypothetical protein
MEEQNRLAATVSCFHDMQLTTTAANDGVLQQIILFQIVASDFIQIGLGRICWSDGECVVAGGEAGDAAERERGECVTAEHGISSGAVLSVGALLRLRTSRVR